jgi:hypothetical protein
MTASWRSTGALIELPEPPGYLQQALLGLHRPVVPPAGARSSERPIWQLMGMMLAGLGVIALTLVGIDFLIAYAYTGRPPY